MVEGISWEVGVMDGMVAVGLQGRGEVEMVGMTRVVC